MKYLKLTWLVFDLYFKQLQVLYFSIVIHLYDDDLLRDTDGFRDDKSLIDQKFSQFSRMWDKYSIALRLNTLLRYFKRATVEFLAGYLSRTAF